MRLVSNLGALVAACQLALAAAPDPQRKPACPVNGPECKCGCVEGKTCTCGLPLRWHPDNGTADLGLWQGDKFLGRYFARTRLYHPWTGLGYDVSAPIPAGAPVSQPQPSSIPLQFAPPPVFFGGFGGGCGPRG